jgi:AcrR family transcriptional regulator
MTSGVDKRLEQRRQAFVEAARKLFLDQGFERTTLADVVAKAGGSLTTLYKLFGNKAGLLAAAVKDGTGSPEGLISEIAENALDPVAALRRFGEQLDKRLLDPDRIAITRIVIAYSLEDADFAADFYRETMLPAQQSLSAAFQKWVDDGVPLHGEPDVLAEIFLGMIVSQVHAEAISHGARSRYGGGLLKDRIDFFCRGAGLSHEETR